MEKERRHRSSEPVWIRQTGHNLEGRHRAAAVLPHGHRHFARRIGPKGELDIYRSAIAFHNFLQRRPLVRAAIQSSRRKYLVHRRAEGSPGFRLALRLQFLFESLENDLTLDWSINGTDHPELASSQSIVLRAPNGVADF